MTTDTYQPNADQLVAVLRHEFVHRKPSRPIVRSKPRARANTLGQFVSSLLIILGVAFIHRGLTHEIEGDLSPAFAGALIPFPMQIEGREALSRPDAPGDVGLVENIKADLASLSSHLARKGSKQTAAYEENIRALTSFQRHQASEGFVASSPMLQGEFGAGKTGLWQAYNQSPDEPWVAAQYLDVTYFADLDFPYPLYHHNLCGQLAVIAALRLDLEDGLRLFKQIEGWEPIAEITGKWVKMSGEKILSERGRTTSGYTLVNFIQEAADGSLDASFDYGYLEFDEIAKMLKQGKLLIALVNIDGSRRGKLRPYHQSDDQIAHWVAILDAVEAAGGPSLVRVYNPFMNQEEFYTWQAFSAAWSETKGNTTPYGLVIAEPIAGPQTNARTQ